MPDTPPLGPTNPPPPEPAVVRARLLLIYNDFRNALLNRKYYGRRLERSRSWNKASEIIVAIAASAPIGAWMIWKAGFGKTMWAWIAGVAALIAVSKPIFNWPKEIEEFSKLYSDYNGLYCDLNYLVQDIQAERALSDNSWGRYAVIRQKIIEIAKAVEPGTDKHLQVECFAEVKREIPANHLWAPS